MITFKAIVIPNHKRDDGTYPVKIRVTYKRVSRRLKTTLVCSSTDLTRSLKIKNADIISKADELILKMRNVVKDISPFELEDKDVDWVVRKIKESLSGDNFKLDFFEWGQKYIKQTKSLSTQKAYERALNALERFLKKRELDINDITKMMLLDFMEFIDKEPKMHYDRKLKKSVETEKDKVAKASSSLHLMKLQHIFKAAKERYNDEDSGVIHIPKSPFDSIKKVFPSGDSGQDALDKSIMQKIILAKTDDPSVRTALDAFIVSFGLMGANLADLYLATPFQGDKWVYNRKKITSRKAEMRVVIQPQILPYLERLQNSDDKEWWLSELHRLGAKKHTCNEKLNDYLRRWQKSEGLESEDFTFYAARHSWGQYARDLGNDLASVNECLCHKDSLEMGRIYASLSWEQKNDINKAVLESFVWE